jgi:hypothetical protein
MTAYVGVPEVQQQACRVLANLSYDIGGLYLVETVPWDFHRGYFLPADGIFPSPFIVTFHRLYLAFYPMSLPAKHT